ncbi:MAG: hypothetical protein ACR2OL_18685 [Anderseniella sp.]
MREPEALADPALAIAALFDGLVAEAKADVENKGCLFVNTALELPNQSDTEASKALKTDAMKLIS